MNIGEFSKRAGLSIDTLRYYNKIGLLVPARNDNNRNYSEEDFEKAIAISKLKALNFSLDEITALFNLEKTIENKEKINNTTIDGINLCLNLMNNKLQQIIKQQQDLIVIKTTLEKIISKTNELIKTPELLEKLK